MITYLLRRGNKSQHVCERILEYLNNPSVQIVKSNELKKLKTAHDILIRWNSIKPANCRFQVNTPESIKLINTKPLARKILIENKILAPITYFSKQDVLHNNPRFPLIGRQTRHSEGSNMVICENKQDVIKDISSTYWSEFINKDKEWRVFTFFGKILGMCEKVPKYPEKIAWNNSLGNGIFKTIKSKDFPIDVCILALKATKVWGADFSAVDIISLKNDHYVLEGGNSPEISPYRQKLFAQAFSWLIKQTEKLGKLPKHFELPEIIKSYKNIRHSCILKKEIDEEKNNV